MTDMGLSQEQWEEWVAVDTADNRFYSLISARQKDILDNWGKTNDVYYRVCWDDKGYPALCAISRGKGKCIFGIPFSKDSTVDDINLFIQLIQVQEVHGS